MWEDSTKLRVLVGCEFSGIVREAFRRQNHEAWSCDLIEAEDGSPWHITGDVVDVATDYSWDMAILFPPCTHLAVSGARWFKDKHQEQHDAIEFIKLLLLLPIKKIALENPIGIISTKVRKPDQIIQPYDFGEDASKATCLWLKGLPKLVSTGFVSPRVVNGKKRWSNQTDSGQNRLGPSEDRWKNRSRTYPGIASAMADQWGSLKET